MLLPPCTPVCPGPELPAPPWGVPVVLLLAAKALATVAAALPSLPAVELLPLSGGNPGAEFVEFLMPPVLRFFAGGSEPIGIEPNTSTAAVGADAEADDDGTVVASAIDTDGGDDNQGILGTLIEGA